MEKEYILNFAQKLLQVDSPTGFTMHAIDFLEKEAKALGYDTVRNQKGNLMIKVEGKDTNHTLGLSAHCDTLGLMVRSIKDNGYLAITPIGSPTLPTLDSEYCRIYTRENKV